MTSLFKVDTIFPSCSTLLAFPYDFSYKEGDYLSHRNGIVYLTPNSLDTYTIGPKYEWNLNDEVEKKSFFSDMSLDENYSNYSSDVSNHLSNLSTSLNSVLFFLDDKQKLNISQYNSTLNEYETLYDYDGTVLLDQFFESQNRLAPRRKNNFECLANQSVFTPKIRSQIRGIYSSKALADDEYWKSSCDVNTDFKLKKDVFSHLTVAVHVNENIIVFFPFYWIHSQTNSNSCQINISTSSSEQFNSKMVTENHSSLKLKYSPWFIVLNDDWYINQLRDFQFVDYNSYSSSDEIIMLILATSTPYTEKESLLSNSSYFFMSVVINLKTRNYHFIRKVNGLPSFSAYICVPNKSMRMCNDVTKEDHNFRSPIFVLVLGAYSICLVFPFLSHHNEHANIINISLGEFVQLTHISCFSQSYLKQVLDFTQASGNALISHKNNNNEKNSIGTSDLSNILTLQRCIIDSSNLNLEILAYNILLLSDYLYLFIPKYPDYPMMVANLLVDKYGSFLGFSFKNLAVDSLKNPVNLYATEIPPYLIKSEFNSEHLDNVVIMIPPDSHTMKKAQLLHLKLSKYVFQFDELNDINKLGDLIPSNTSMNYSEFLNHLFLNDAIGIVFNTLDMKNTLNFIYGDNSCGFTHSTFYEKLLPLPFIPDNCVVIQILNSMSKKKITSLVSLRSSTYCFNRIDERNQTGLVPSSCSLFGGHGTVVDSFDFFNFKDTLLSIGFPQDGLQLFPNLDSDYSLSVSVISGGYSEIALVTIFPYLCHNSLAYFNDRNSSSEKAIIQSRNDMLNDISCMWIAPSVNKKYRDAYYEPIIQEKHPKIILTSNGTSKKQFTLVADLDPDSQDQMSGARFIYHHGWESSCQNMTNQTNQAFDYSVLTVGFGMAESSCQYSDISSSSPISLCRCFIQVTPTEIRCIDSYRLNILILPPINMRLQIASSNIQKYTNTFGDLCNNMNISELIAIQSIICCDYIVVLFSDLLLRFWKLVHDDSPLQKNWKLNDSKCKLDVKYVLNKFINTYFATQINSFTLFSFNPNLVQKKMMHCISHTNEFNIDTNSVSQSVFIFFITTSDPYIIYGASLNEMVLILKSPSFETLNTTVFSFTPGFPDIPRLSNNKHHSQHDQTYNANNFDDNHMYDVDSTSKISSSQKKMIITIEFIWLHHNDDGPTLVILQHHMPPLIYRSFLPPYEYSNNTFPFNFQLFRPCLNLCSLNLCITIPCSFKNTIPVNSLILPCADDNFINYCPRSLWFGRFLTIMNNSKLLSIPSNSQTKDEYIQRLNDEGTAVILQCFLADRFETSIDTLYFLYSCDNRFLIHQTSNKIDETMNDKDRYVGVCPNIFYDNDFLSWITFTKRNHLEIQIAGTLSPYFFFKPKNLYSFKPYIKSYLPLGYYYKIDYNHEIHLLASISSAAHRSLTHEYADATNENQVNLVTPNDTSSSSLKLFKLTSETLFSSCQPCLTAFYNFPSNEKVLIVKYIKINGITTLCIGSSSHTNCKKDGALGKLYIFNLDYYIKNNTLSHVNEKMSFNTEYDLMPTFQQLYSGPVLCLNSLSVVSPLNSKESSLVNLFIHSAGNKLFIHEYEYDNLVRGSFYDSSFTITSIATIKSYIIIADVITGPHFLMFRIICNNDQISRSLVKLGDASNTIPNFEFNITICVEFLSIGPFLHILSAIESGFISVYQFFTGKETDSVYSRNQILNKNLPVVTKDTPHLFRTHIIDNLRNESSVIQFLRIRNLKNKTISTIALTSLGGIHHISPSLDHHK